MAQSLEVALADRVSGGSSCVEPKWREAHRRCKNAAGFVLEFQNSPMNDAELFSREALYGNMAWVVNGESFSKNIVFDLLAADKT